MMRGKNEESSKSNFSFTQNGTDCKGTDGLSTAVTKPCVHIISQSDVMVIVVLIMV